MSVVYLCSDWHIGHKSVTKWRDFKTEEEHSDLIISNYMKVVKNSDIVWFLGDIVFNLEAIEKVSKLPGDKRLVLGNHDIERGGTFQDLLEVFTQIHSLVKYKKVWLSHAPIHPSELRGRVNVHGHSHDSIIDDDRYINICPEIVGYYPIKYQDIAAWL